ncbi:hypothetical protein IFM89_016047 [Coptis chinensis]|uniref:DUF4283 domain-containing protein n=1 Tax=Coptis chinensis TaxID=261450 RepID=A0A835H4P2_9MAGN|nr:hypothetical protein IFM89_016047 [Coptis chinensis]
MQKSTVLVIPHQQEDSSSKNQIEELQQKMKKLLFEKKKQHIIEINCLNAEALANDALTLIGKLHGGLSPNLEEVGKEVHRIWQTTGNIELERIDRDHVKFRFENSQECKHVKTNGPWMVGGFILSIKEWERDRRLDEYNFELVSFWVQIWDLPKDRINKVNVWKIGEELGLVIEADTSCPPEFNHPVARVRVEMDVTERLTKEQQLKLETGEELTVRLKYEKLETFCYFCGVIGHEHLRCRIRNQYRYELLKCGGSIKDIKPNFTSQIKANKFYNGVAFTGKQVYTIEGTPSKLRFEETPAPERERRSTGNWKAQLRVRQNRWEGSTSTEQGQQKDKTKGGEVGPGDGIKESGTTATSTVTFHKGFEMGLPNQKNAQETANQAQGPDGTRYGLVLAKDHGLTIYQSPIETVNEKEQGCDLAMEEHKDVLGLVVFEKINTEERGRYQDPYIDSLQNYQILTQEEGMIDRCQPSGLEATSSYDQARTQICFQAITEEIPGSHGVSSRTSCESQREFQEKPKLQSYNRSTRGRGYKIMASRGRREKVSKSENKSRLGSIVREPKAQNQGKNPKRKHSLSEEEEDDMVMNGGDGWIRRSKRIGEQRSKKAKQRATDLRSQGKGHLLIPRNANIVQLSSDSATPTTSEELIDIDSTTDPSPTESEGTHDSVTSYESGVSEEIMVEHQAPMEVYFSDDDEDRMVHDTEKQLSNERVGYEADGEQLTSQPQPLAMDDSSVDRRSSQWGQTEKKAQMQEGQSSVDQSQKMDDESTIRGQEKGDDYSGGLSAPPAVAVPSQLPWYP